ncbi:hypothetical protein NKI88_12185 [Mesorhizobium sp. M0317]|uniref:hypothetical protein n=1 Tax=Mesorhizobium sp. M0317 TaxID=2956935 RepID=UPI00333A66DE
MPTVADGQILPDQAAMERYGQTGENLGKFDNPAHADMYAEALHKAQDQHYGAAAQSNAAPAIPPGFKVVQPASVSAKGDRVGQGSFGAPPFAPANGPWTKYQAAASQSPNVFDQFDQSAKDDPWAGFPDASPIEVKAPDGTTVRFPAGTPDDVMAKAMRETFDGPADSAATPAADGPWTKYAAPAAPAGGNNIESLIRGTEQAPASVSTAKDVGLSFGSGIPRGLAETAMFPITLSRTVEGAGNWLYNNAQTRPLYDAAQQQIIPQAHFGPIAADPRFTAGLARLRGNPELAPDYAHLPDNSIGVVDAVTKDLNARGEALSSVANPLYGPELAGKSTGSAAEARNAATNHSPAYAQALAEREALRRTALNPLEQGPVGRVAAAKDTAGAGNAILPQNPLTGSAGEAAAAARRLVAEDSAATAGLVRQNLADRFSKANTETQDGVRDFAGAKFHKDVAGNDARQEVLDAVLREIPGGHAAASMPELLDVLQATGRRKQIGSATEFNRSMNADLGGAASPTGMAVSLVKSLGTSVVKAGNVAKRAALRSNLRSLADMFIDPRSVELIRNANNRGARIGFGEALARTGAETGGTIYDPAGQR